VNRSGDIHAQSHVRLGIFFAENPQNQPHVKVLRLTLNTAAAYARKEQWI